LRRLDVPPVFKAALPDFSLIISFNMLATVCVSHCVAAQDFVGRAWPFNIPGYLDDVDK
jgi:hypothetical protein